MAAALLGRDAVERVGRRMRDLAAAAPGPRQLHERRLERRADGRPRPEVRAGLHLDARRAHRTASTSAVRRRRSRAAQRVGEALDLVVGRDLGRTDQQGVAQSGVVGIPARQRQAGQHAALEERGVDAGGVGHRDRELVEVGAAVDARRAGLGQGAFQLAGPGRRRRPPRRAARADRAWPGRPWPPARRAPGWCRCCWPPCRGGCPARARAAS